MAKLNEGYEAFDSVLLVFVGWPWDGRLYRLVYDDTSHLKEEAPEFIWKRSIEHWLDIHGLDFFSGTDESGKEKERSGGWNRGRG